MTHADSPTPPQPPEWPVTNAAVQEAFEAMMRDGSWGRYHGPHCDNLRDALRKSHSVEHAILCCSGTSAIELALRAAKVEPGDDVILAAYDYKANFANVLVLGATPVLVDTLPGLPILDPSQLNKAITPNTRAIICSHLHGCFAQVNPIQSIAAEHNVVVVEDACQASGGILNNRPAGSLGDVGVLSFGGSKLLTAGRGGAVLTNDATLAQRIRLHTQRGNDAYPLSEMQAAVLLPQLNQLPKHTQQRLKSVNTLLQQLPANGPLKPSLPTEDLSSEHTIPAFYKLAFQYDAVQNNGTPRDNFAAAVRKRGVALDPAFPALHKIHSKRRFRAVGALPNATALHETLLTLHHPVLLENAATLKQVATCIAAEITPPNSSA